MQSFKEASKTDKISKHLGLSYNSSLPAIKPNYKLLIIMQIHFDYTLKWNFKLHPQYAITTCKKVINTHRGTIVKKTINGGSIGWWICGNFITQSKINNHVQLITKEKSPF